MAERLHCGVWANSIDARRLVTNGGAGLTSRAISTVPTPRQARKPTSLLGTGALAVCDGGSLYVGRSDGVDPPALHRISPEHTMQQPVVTKTPTGVRLPPDQSYAATEPRGAGRVIAHGTRQTHPPTST